MLYVAIIIVVVLIIVRYLLLFVAFDTFHTPTSSMTPTLKQDYTGLVTKTRLGGRYFDFKAAAEGRPFTVRRMPGYGKLKKNDIIVFNAPWTKSWDSIAMNMRLYYCKRAVAVAGDTLQIIGGHYRVKGFKGILGVAMEQEYVRDYVEHIRSITPDSVPMEGSVYAAPRDSSLNWTIADMGPLVVPAAGMTIKLDRKNYLIYHKYIEWETGKKLLHPDSLQARRIPSYSLQDRRIPSDSVGLPAPVQQDSSVLILDEYTFRENYCFAAGDHAVNSQDSRYWGFLPEKFIVGIVDTPRPGSFHALLDNLLIKFLRL